MNNSTESATAPASQNREIPGVTFQTEGRRVYVLGNTFPIKDAIKDAGGHWDGERKAWWIGAKKQEELIAACAKLVKHKPESETYDGEVKGKVKHKGRTYFVICATKEGDSVKLTGLDGKITFWANMENVEVVKRYEAREERGNYGRATGRSSYPSLAGIRKFVEDKKKEDRGERDPNEPTKQCWECGCAFTFRDAKANGGDWQDSYCGC